MKKYKKGNKVLVLSGKNKGSIYTIELLKPKKNLAFLSELSKEVTKKQKNGETKKKIIFTPVHISNLVVQDMIVATNE